eukprot:6176393-Pleurochrysis_carterae.AAC.1
MESPTNFAFVNRKREPFSKTILATSAAVSSSCVVRLPCESGVGHAAEATRHKNLRTEQKTGACWRWRPVSRAWALKRTFAKHAEEHLGAFKGKRHVFENARGEEG